MASYFDEHNCKPLETGETPNHELHLARLLIDGGWTTVWQDLFSNLTGHMPNPPASKKAISELIKPTNKEGKCPVCLDDYSSQDLLSMPCNHIFHEKCLLTWLKRTNTCPECRFELETDNEMYENNKKMKARQKQREFEIDQLHDSMYG